VQRTHQPKQTEFIAAGAESAAFNAVSFLPFVASLTTHPVMISDIDGGTVWVNEAFTRVSGWPLNEIVGLKPPDFLHGPKTDPVVVRLIYENVTAGKGFQCEILNYKRDGSIFWISLDAQPITDQSGKLIGYLSVQSDISDRKRFEAALLREHWLLETVSVCLSKYISTDNPRTAFEDLLVRLLALTSSEYGFIGEVCNDASGAPWMRTLALSDISWNEETHQLYKENAARGFEFRNLKTLFGEALVTARPVISNSPATDERSGGIPAGHPPLNQFLALPILRDKSLVGLIGIANCADGYSEADVTFLQPLVTAIGQLIDAHRRDVQRRETERSLRQTEEWLEETGRVAEVGAWQIDLSTMTLRWSAQTHRMHEVPSDYVPTVDAAINFYAPEARDSIRNAVTKAMQDGTPWDLELPFVTAKGRHRWMRAMGHAVWEDGRVVRLFGSFKDITERRLIAEERERLQEQVTRSQRMDSVGRLAGGIAHDFNNMLAVILGHSEMLLLDETLPSKYRVHLKAIQTAGHRSAAMTQQLLTFARRQNASPQKVNINKAVERMLDLLRKSMGEKIEIEWMQGEGAWTVNIDPVQLDQILANLCINSRDAISDHGRIMLSTRNETLRTTRKFRTHEVRPGKYVVLTVSDTGCGISEATLTHLFEPYNTTKRAGDGPGPGLGLATVYGIVNQNGGSIDVESSPEIGTTFRIYLPRHGGSEKENTAQTDTAAVPKGGTVLFVENEPAMLRIGKLSLRQLGYKVLVATTIEEAVQKVRAQGSSIDVVLTDVVLGGGNGWTLAQEIQEIHPAMRFVFMSGLGEHIAIGQATSSHPFKVLTKPFDLQRLSNAVREAVSMDHRASFSA
jgi:PAS domain S-box-containing protein